VPPFDRICSDRRSGRSSPRRGRPPALDTHDDGRVAGPVSARYTAERQPVVTPHETRATRPRGEIRVHLHERCFVNDAVFRERAQLRHHVRVLPPCDGTGRCRPIPDQARTSPRPDRRGWSGPSCRDRAPTAPQRDASVMREKEPTGAGGQHQLVQSSWTLVTPRGRTIRSDPTHPKRRPMASPDRSRRWPRWPE